MGAEGIEPPSVGLEPTIIPVYYAPIYSEKFLIFKFVYPIFLNPRHLHWK
jgi:hypothetical protein